MIKLTKQERKIVKKLNDPLYTVDYLETWINREDNVVVNVIAALNSCLAKGFYHAVAKMAKQNSKKPEALTAGLVKELSAGRNIPQLDIFLEGREDDEMIDILNRNDYFATKLWSIKDIEGRLIAKGLSPSKENIEKVMDTGVLKELNDCTDYDWDVIDYAIDIAQKKSNRKGERK